MVTFQLEPWALFQRDAEDLWYIHAAAIGASLPPALDGTFYQFLESSGQLMILTARRAGCIVGYVMVLVRRHPHYDVLCGFEDAYFLLRSERRGRVGIRMIQRAIEECKARGCKRVFFHEKEAASLPRFFSHLGFSADSTIWVKEL